MSGDELETQLSEPAEISRREALAKLAKYSAYTAPTVVTLLASRPSLAQLASCGPGINDGAPSVNAMAVDMAPMMGVDSDTTNTANTNDMGMNADTTMAADSKLTNTAADCGIAT